MELAGLMTLASVLMLLWVMVEPNRRAQHQYHPLEKGFDRYIIVRLAEKNPEP